MAALPPSFFQGLTRRLRELQARGVDVIRMDMGSPDMPPPPFIVDALKHAAEQPAAHGYTPFAGLPSYRAAWAEFYGRRFGVELDPDSELMGLLGSRKAFSNCTWPT
jgi:LL-diaminopimelate aminotransferase